MSIYGDYLVSLQNTGLATIYRLTENGKERIRQFPLASHNKVNHANVADFGIERVEKDDVLPVLYVSQCSRDRYEGMKDVCFVERIRLERMTIMGYANFVSKSYGYGMGFFEAPPAEMELYRRTIDANPARFARLAEDIEALGKYKVIGPRYARPKGSYDEPVASWYERKWVGVEAMRDLEGEAFTPELPRILADAFEELTPMYRFLLEVHLAAGKAGLFKEREERHG